MENSSFFVEKARVRRPGQILYKSVAVGQLYVKIGSKEL
jgi:hypothetical protein